MLQTSRPPVLVAQQCCFGPKGFGLQSIWKIANSKFHAIKFLTRKDLHAVSFHEYFTKFAYTYLIC